MHYDDLSRYATIGAAAFVLVTTPLFAQEPSPVTANAPAVAANAPVPPAPKCVVPADLARFDLPLSRLAFRISGGQPVKIVAIGSSSTFGAGASSPSASYPGRLEVELQRHFPGHALTVINRGVNGEEALDMLARFETGVIAENPQLVIWQVGTNSLLRDHPLDSRGLVLHDGLRRLKAIRADVVLMDPQYAPRVLAKADRDSVVATIAQVAKEEKVGLLRRFELMRRWHETDGLPFDVFVSPDGLHMNDWGYACLAKTLGAAIAEAVTRPTETASVPSTTR